MKAFLDLASKWESVARNKFISASGEEHEIHRRFIEHGAICYYNCATQLRELIKAGDVALDLGTEVLQEDGECPGG